MVIILRGPSGAGKSTWAKKQKGAFIVSADSFFMKNGEYQFDPKKLGEAHAKCLRDFTHAVSSPDSQDDLIIVDNTNTTITEVAPYAALALAFGHEMTIMTFVGDAVKAARRNVHLVPATSVVAMAERIDKSTALFPPWWNHEVVAY
jgi:predicted kinase